MLKLQYSLLLLAIIFIAACSNSAKKPEAWQSPLLQNHPLVGNIYAIKNSHAVSQAELIKQLSQHHYVLIGEKHDNPDHHVLQEKLLNELLKEQAYPQVVFEMLDDSQHEALKHINSKRNSSEETIQQQLNWQNQAWPWQHYGPLFQSVLKNQVNIRDGNVNKASIKAVYSQGKKALQPPERFTSMQAIDENQQAILLEHIYINHCKMMPKESLQPMVSIQTAKDASMANALVVQEKGILIAGNYHNRKDLGVPQHLHFLKIAEQDIAVLMLIEVADDKPTLNDYEEASLKQADYIWFTPKWTDKDYCAAMKEKMGKK
jgi:uncharacterized iron-regulated protein